MSIRSVKGAPQLTRLLRDLPDDILHTLMAAAPFRTQADDLDDRGPDSGATDRTSLRDAFSAFRSDDLAPLEREASRITRLDGSTADALHLRLADGIDFKCRAPLEDLPGALARAAWSFSKRPELFRSVERAMQMRSYRDHRTIYEAYDVQVPVALGLERIDVTALEAEMSDRLDLAGGCAIEAVELPATGQSDREIMLAVTSGGPLASQRTFEDDKRVDMIQFRPANELILVYRPKIGRIEICGRDWSDRKAAARLVASKVLEQDLSERPLTQRNYSLHPFAKSLRPDIPSSLADRISELHVTEARYALGNYDRKVTVSALAGEPIEQIARTVLKGLATRHGKPFLCDVELFLRINLPDRGSQPLRFRITNQNRSTLQSEKDPGKRNIGFALMQALGVVTTLSDPKPEDVTTLLPGLLALLDHAQDTIGHEELRAIEANTARLTSNGFLHQRNIATTVLIDDDDIGPTEARVVPDVSDMTAAIGIGDDDVLEQRDVDNFFIWTINRDYVREYVLKRIASLTLSRKPEDRGHGVYALGEARVGGERRPVYLWERGGDLELLDKVDRTLRDRSHLAPCLVLTPGPRPVAFLGKHLLLTLGDLLDPETDGLDIDRLDRLWAEGRAMATAADGVEFQNRGNCAVLIVPGQDPWTITGAARVKLVQMLYDAYKTGEPLVQTADLVAHTGSTSPQAVFGPDWKPIVHDRYIHSPKRRFWALKVRPA